MIPGHRPIKGVLFDKDGTLLDFEATWGPATAAVIAVLAEDDEAVQDELALAAGFKRADRRFVPASPVIAGATEEFVDTWARIVGQPCDATFIARLNRLFDEHSLRSLTGYDDVSSGVDALVAMGLQVGLATNDTQTSAHAHLESMGVLDRFTFIAGYDSGHGAKPGPGMIHAFARHAGIDAREVAMIGDTGHDMAAARAAGALAVGIARTEAARAALEGLTDLMIEDLPALCAAFRETAEGKPFTGPLEGIAAGTQ